MCICESDEFRMIKGLDPFRSSHPAAFTMAYASSTLLFLQDKYIFYDVHILGKAISASHCLNGDRPTKEVICFDTDLLA